MTNQSDPRSPHSLREQAEAVWQSRHRDRATIAPEDANALVHELEVHQIELELQNEELRRAQSELEESRDQLRDLYDFAPVGYLTLREDAVIQQANLRAAVLLGVERDALIGKRFTRFLARESQDAFHLYWRALYPDGPPQACDLLLRKSDGTAVPVSMKTAEQKGARPPAWRCAISDITARKHAEAKLRESEKRYRQLAEEVTDGIFVADLRGRYLDANRAGCEMLGYTLEELTTLTFADVLAPDELKKLPDKFRSLASEAVVRSESHFRRKDGSVFIGELVGHQYPDGHLHYVVRDITERKHVEEALRDEARRKDEFLAVLGHELRNPLAAISTALEVISTGATSAQRMGLEELMSQQVALVRRLMDDLLDLSRLMHGHIELRKEGVDLAELLERAATYMEPAIAEHGQELLVRLPSEPVQFMADPIRLDQILGNLLRNACKYTGRGGRIELSGAREDSEVVFRCKDNGQGILPENLERIFDPFVRGRKTDLGSGEASLGVGLALSKQLAQLHGGTITVASAGADRGCEFTVRLPLVAGPAERRGARQPQPALASQQRRSIVVVEDNPTVARVIKIALEQAGQQVHMFSDGPSVLAAIAGLEPDVVLLDIGLPGMSGYELAAKLKQQRRLRHAVFIAISGFKQMKQATKPDGDFDYYFTKPVNVRALLALLDGHSRAEATEAAHERRELEESGQLRVLLVEDHADVVAATASLLRREGLEVKTASTGGEALEAAGSFRPQLILCDMNLPDMKGLEVIRGLRSHPSTQQACAIILTAMSKSEIQRYNSEAKRLGVDKFMSKPITRENIRTLASKLKPRRRTLRQK